MGKKQITISLDKHIVEWLEKRAKSDYLNISNWLNQLLNRLKEEQEREVKHDQSN
jgi:Arc/MetJ-type ribon-helix-helix transcriptional regulator